MCECVVWHMCVLRVAGRQGLGRVWERQARTPIITLASDARREEIPPTVLSEPKLLNYVVVLNLSFSACKRGDLRFMSLMLGWAWISTSPPNPAPRAPRPEEQKSSLPGL